jgi:uncharacterized phiE125 gp8 family phage protein
VAIDWTRWDSDPYFSNSSSWDIRPPWVRPMRPTSIRWALKLVTGPSSEPLLKADVKLHLRIDTTDDDAELDNLISAAREYIEVRTGLALLPQTWQLVLDRWPRTDRQESWPWMAVPVGAILLPRYPVTAVSSIAYQGSDGSNNTMSSSDYVVDLVSRLPRVTLVSNKSWPSKDLVPQAGIQVQFVAGYANAATVPARVKQLMQLLIGSWYMNREGIVVDSRAVAVEVERGLADLLSLSTPPLVG